MCWLAINITQFILYTPMLYSLMSEEINVVEGDVGELKDLLLGLFPSEPFFQVVLHHFFFEVFF